MTLSGKVAIVTGGNSGIGKAIVLALAQQGASIVIDYVADAKAEEDLDEGRNATLVAEPAVSGVRDVQAPFKHAEPAKDGPPWLIDGEWVASTLVKITADDVTLRNCEIRHGRHNALTIVAKNAVIDSCTRPGFPIARTGRMNRDSAGEIALRFTSFSTTVSRLLLMYDGARNARLNDRRIVCALAGLSSSVVRGEKTASSIDENLSKRAPTSHRMLL
jgi:NAD(P)-dependent dehydrogenase (short-subunit alcohol dehydrogenase family)